MRIFFRGTNVNFSTEFLDEDGDPVDTATATLIIMYPDTGWPMNGATLTKEAVTLTEQTDNTWTGTWDSRVSQPGVIQWHAYTADSDMASEDGFFRLRGNMANLEVE